MRDYSIFNDIINKLTTDLKELQKKDPVYKPVLIPHHIAWDIMQASYSVGSGFIAKDGCILVYDKCSWVDVSDSDLKVFLRFALEAYTGDKVNSTERKLIDNLTKQFPYTALTLFPSQAKDKINFKNGTLDLKTSKLMPHNPYDYFRYVLPYDYDPTATCTMFHNYLEEVVPEIQERMVIAEYIAYLFTDLKLEKVLFLYGAGCNGKSVLVDIIEALIGCDNICHESISDMCGENGSNSRSNLVGKILNTCSDVSAKAFQGDIFKRLASGEPISFKILYKDVNTSTEYAKQLFCLNELPKTSDTSNGYFRRFLIAPFPVQIPKNKVNPKLAKEIIANELPGIMNWVLEGRNRLIQQNAFTESSAMEKEIEKYKNKYTKKDSSLRLLLPPYFK